MDSFQNWFENSGEGGGGKENDPFLDKLHQIMFSSYVKKTIQETRKHYYIREKTYQERIYQADFEEDSHEGSAALLEFDLEGRPNHIIEAQDLLKLLLTLTLKQRIIIAGYYLYEKTEGELARELKISRQAVNKIRKRALDNIKKKYNEENKW
ncbi:MAG TPA: sigma factor-like helix-turn-helix DNA-binding protein [Bacillota bacterium]|nr:sigma factor-like helix-turn-helix DNA-binding protein [Bacillota bacterium]